MKVDDHDLSLLSNPNFAFIEGEEITKLAKTLLAKTKNAGIKNGDLAKLIEALESVKKNTDDNSSMIDEIILVLRILEYHLEHYFLSCLNRI